MKGLGSLHWEKVHSSTSRSCLLSLSPLCPWPTALSICFSAVCLTPCLSSPDSLSSFSVSLGLSAPAPHPSGLSSRCLAQAGRVPALTEGYWKLQQPFCSLPWHLGSTGEPEGNLAFSPSFICVERVILSCVWLILFGDTLFRCTHIPVSVWRAMALLEVGCKAELLWGFFSSSPGWNQWEVMAHEEAVADGGRRGCDKVAAAICKREVVFKGEWPLVGWDRRKKRQH